MGTPSWWGFHHEIFSCFRLVSNRVGLFIFIVSLYKSFYLFFIFIKTKFSYKIGCSQNYNLTQ